MPTPFIGPPDEMAGLTMFLDSQRDAVLHKVAGLSDEEAKRVPTASSLSLFAIVKHLAFVERRSVPERGRGQRDPWPVAPR